MNLNANNLSNVRVRVYTSIFPKILKSSFDLEMGVFKYEKIDFDHKNLLGYCKKGLRIG